MFDTSEFITAYLTEKFKGKYKISASGKELIANSPFEEDKKYKFSINISTGLWRDFKAHTQGNFTQLYSFLEAKTYRQAQIAVLLGSLRKVEKSSYKPPLACSHDLQKTVDTFLPVTIESGDSAHPGIRDAWTYLFGRQLFDLENPVQTYFYCEEGDFIGRVILPFWRNEKVVFFQGRSLNEQHSPKYLTPSTEYGIKSSDMLYPFDTKQEYVVICEGPIDAISLQLEGVNATATMGSNISNIQISTLKKWGGKLICGYDNDEAGRKGVMQIDRMRKEYLMAPIEYVFPVGAKDWNEMRLKDLGCQVHIQKNSRVFNALEFDIENKLSTL